LILSAPSMGCSRNFYRVISECEYGAHCSSTVIRNQNPRAISSFTIARRTCSPLAGLITMQIGHPRSIRRQLEVAGCVCNSFGRKGALRCPGMLRITARVEPTETVLELEGTLTGLWTEELERCWEKWRTDNRPVKVMLKAVSFIDLPGKTLLARMHRTGTALEGEGCMTRAIVEAITAGEKT
jgi:hypothetical protein